MADRAVLEQYQNMRTECQNLLSRISELEGEHHEHNLVLTALKDLEEDRKCFRLVGGVLVERTVKEVRPAVQTNADQLHKMIEDFHKTLDTKNKALRDFQTKHKIQVGENELRSAGNQGGAAASGKGKEKSGVLA